MVMENTMDTDRPYAGEPSISTASLGEALPEAPRTKKQRDFTRAELYEQAKVKFAAREAALERRDEQERLQNQMRLEQENESKASHKRRNSSPGAGQKFTRLGQNDAMDLDAVPEPFDFQAIALPLRIRCAFRVGTSATIGNPYAATKGYAVQVAVDGGRFGQPSIRLYFKVNKGDNKQKDLFKNDEDLDTFTVTWYPGVKIQGRVMLEYYESARVASKQDEQDNWTNSSIQNASRDRDTNKLACIRFLAASHVATEQPANLYQGLDNETIKGLLALLEGQKDYPIAIWFLVPSNYERFEADCLSHFENAFKTRQRPLHQYMVDGEYSFHINNAPSVKAIGNGMYCIYPKMLDSKGKKTQLDDYSKEPDFAHLETKTVWEEPSEFGVYYQLAVLREVQFTKGKLVHLQLQPHRVYLQNLPFPRLQGKISTAQETLSKDQKLYRSSYHAYVRMPPNPEGLQEAVPPEDSQVVLEWDNSVQGIRGHIPSSDDSKSWFGSVIKVAARNLKDTSTEFCIQLTKPSSASPRKSYEDLSYKPNQELHLAHLKITYPTDHAVREMGAVRTFADLSDAGAHPALDYVRQAIISNPSNATHSNIDLRLGHPERQENIAIYEGHLRAVVAGMRNPTQAKVLGAPSQTVNGLHVIEGPPGTGKTLTLAQQTWLLSSVGHIILLTAPSNGAVDKAATDIWNCPRPARMANKKVLRLEVSRLETKALLAIKPNAYANIENVDRIASDQFKIQHESFEQDPVYQDLYRAVTDEEQFDLETFQKFKAEVQDFKKAWEMMQTIKHDKISDVPIATTLNWHIGELRRADFAAAQRKWAEAKAALSPEAQATFAKTVSEFDESDEYNRHVEYFIEQQGQLDRQTRNAFKVVRQNMELRVVRSMDIVLASCNNSGCKLLVGGFDPTILYCDEAGQATIPTLCVPMVSFRHWKALFLYGDSNQLEPICLSGSASEVAKNSRMSPLGLLTGKKCRSTMLDLQYRMCPAISRFPAQHFYDNLLDNAPQTVRDNTIRKAMRLVSTKYYGVKGDGSEYWFVDVARGTARVQAQGSSLQNFANADAICTAIGRLVKEGINPSIINILSLYKGQKSVVMTKLIGVPGGLWRFGDVATVDSFQGRQAPIVLLDIVAAASQGTSAANGDDVYTMLSAHARDPHRICVGLTRAQYGLIIFGQVRLLMQAPSKAITVSKLVADADDRGLIYRDLTTLDSHPAAVEERKAWTQAVFKAEEKKAKAADYAFIGKKIAQSHTLHRFTPDAHPRIYYRTPSGLTTRVSGPGYVMERANAHDQSKGKEPRQEVPQFKIAGGTQRGNKDAKKDKQATREPKEQDMGKRPTADPLATSSGKPVSDTTMGGTTEPITLTAEEKALLKPDPSGGSWSDEVADAMDEGKDDGEVQE